MREINIVVCCDMCIAQGSTTILGETEAVSVKLTIDGGAHREMDLCPSCLADFVNMSRTDTGTKTKAKAKPTRKVGSSWARGKDYTFESPEQMWACGQCEASFTTEQGVKIHLGLAH